ncbi:hypothetical protein L1887_56468 [Cichorium endivia]|nr:hypothetical protein L1887_56468 [Cichorium endivia]
MSCAHVRFQNNKRCPSATSASRLHLAGSKISPSRWLSVHGAVLEILMRNLSPLSSLTSHHHMASMKRSRSPSPTSSSRQGNIIPQSHASDMACPHLSAAFTALAPPRPSQHVHKEECTLCFDDQDGPNGVDVCLLCFNGACTGNGDREHSRLHFEKAQHPLVVNIRRVRKPAPVRADGDQPSVPKKLAIAAESDADKYDHVTVPRCLACDPAGPGKELPMTDKLDEVIRGIMTAMSSAQQSEVKAWEEEIVACQHTRELVQPGERLKLEPSGLASCGKCELTSNLWLCLTCGHLGCGRAQFGGVGGNSHGLSHFEESGHPKENRKLAGAAAPTEDPTDVFGFGLEQRLQCNECHKVRYSVERQDAGLSLPVPIRAKPVQTEGSGKQPAEGVHAAPASSAATVEYEPVSLTECLDIFTAPEELEYNCPSCAKKVTATKRTLFTTFPQVLALQVRRFQLLNWVPQKVPVPIVVPIDAPLDLDRYLGRGQQPDEVELPESEAAPASAGASEPEWDAGVMSQLTSMGFPEIRCKKALLATGMGDAEGAMNWLFAHMEDADIDDPIDFGAAPSGVAPSAGEPDTSMLEEMGFTRNQARKALRINNGNAEIAVAWLFENPDDAGEDAAPGETVGETSGESSVVPGSAHLPAKYAIKSFISHKGPSVHSGHYVAHVRHDQDWTFFNDEKVVRAPLSSAAKEGDQDVGVKGLSQQAYVYFFERI